MAAKYKLALIPEGYRVVPEEAIPYQLEHVGPMNNYECGLGTADKDHSEWYAQMVKAAPQLDTPPVLRWEGPFLKMYDGILATVTIEEHGYGVAMARRWSGCYISVEVARSAAEKALGFPDGLIIEEV